MDDIYYHFGQTLKKIRINKGYTQEEIADGKMSRSNYTKVENDEINPNVVKFFTILEHINMSVEEFSFILNGYSLTQKEIIMYLFKHMSQSPAPAYLERLIEQSRSYLTDQKDPIVQDILNLSLGYSALLIDHDLKKAQNHAGKVWGRLEKLDKLYLAEYHLLNRILYFFELETAVFMTNKALEDLQEYETFKEADDLRLSYLSHIACLLIDSGQYSRATVYVDHLIAESKQVHQVIDLGAALVRKGMILKETGSTEAGEKAFSSAIDIFKIMDLSDYVNGTLQNPKAVHNPFGYVDLKKN
ncbi:MAG: helix-turn-helix transcriptional regulator [Alkalibacterium sp.]